MLMSRGDLFAGDATAAVEAHARGALVFHRGRIGGHFLDWLRRALAKAVRSGVLMAA
jgi:hypothetical protein